MALHKYIPRFEFIDMFHRFRGVAQQYQKSWPGQSQFLVLASTLNLTGSRVDHVTTCCSISSSYSAFHFITLPVAQIQTFYTTCCFIRLISSGSFLFFFKLMRKMNENFVLLSPPVSKLAGTLS